MASNKGARRCVCMCVLAKLKGNTQKQKLRGKKNEEEGARRRMNHQKKEEDVTCYSLVWEASDPDRILSPEKAENKIWIVVGGGAMSWCWEKA